jgi:trehalose 6-phosphate phosphatase
LAAIALRIRLVAIVSGRPLAYLVEHVGDAGRTELVGLYGLERAPSATGIADPAPEAEVWRAAVDTAASMAESAAPSGVAVERKGLTVTFHFRAEPERAAEVDSLARRLAERTGLVAHGGKMSVELRPPVDTDKGTVVAEMAAGLGVIGFIGDDLGDLPAFAALAAARTAGAATLGVAAGGPETPQEVLDAADMVVDGPAGVVEVLRAIAGAAGRGP